MLGWKILFMKPILGDLKGYWSGSSTCIFQTPPANGAVDEAVRRAWHSQDVALTFSRAIETDVELLHIVIDKIHFIIGHQPEKQTMSAEPWR